MSKVVIADVDNNMFLKGLVNEGVVLQFGVGGKYLGEFPISYNLSNLKSVDIVSILCNNKNIEIGLNIDERFTKFQTSMDLGSVNDVLMTKLTGYSVGFRRELDIEGVRCIQYIFVFERNHLPNYNLGEMLK